MSSRNKVNHEFEHLVRRFVTEYPYLRHCLDSCDLIEKIEATDSCQVSGRVFNTKTIRYNIIPLDPFQTNVLVTANRVAIVCRDVRKQYHELVEYILQNPDMENINDYKNSLIRFSLTNDLVRKSPIVGMSKAHFFDVEDYSSLFVSFNEKTKAEIRKEKIREGFKSDVVVNNLKEKKKKTPQAKKPDSLFSLDAIYSKIETYKTRSKNKGLTSDVTFENSQRLFQRKYCQLTGMLLNVHKKSEYAQPDSFSIDRINRFEGYNITNMIVLCHEANQVKGTLEKFNYSEDIDNIKHILKETKLRILNKYKDNSEFKFKFKEKKARPIDLILKYYIVSRKNRTNMQFVI